MAHALHVYDRIGPIEATALARVITGLGGQWRHTIAAATPIAADIRRAIGGGGGSGGAFAIGFPALAGRTSFARLRRIGGAMQGFDLILTHGFGAIDAAMAHTLFAQAFGLPPLLHHENAADPARSRRRDWYRRLALGRASAVIVPTERLRAIAIGAWQQPPSRVRLIPPGADIATFARRPRADALPRLVKRQGERWLGVIGDDVLPGLDTLGRLPDAWQLVWFGDGPAREAVRAAAIARDIAHRVHTPGAAALMNLADAIGLLDLVAFTDSDPPLDILVAAMAAGLAIGLPPGTAPGVSCTSEDLMGLLSAENTAEPCATIEHLATDDLLRGRIGAANRAKAQADFALPDILSARLAIYTGAAGRKA